MSSAARIELRPRPGPRLSSGPRLELLPAHEPEVFNGLRAVRTLAMLSIVGYHVTWEPIFGIAFGLTSLQVIMCALAGRRPSAYPLAEFTRKRARRLLAPWILWSALYGLFEIVRSLLAGDSPRAQFESWMWVSGSSFHLWFLPFAFAASLSVNVIQRLFRRPRPHTHVAVSALVGSALLLGADPLKSYLQPTMPFDLWIDGTPAMAFGLAIGRSLTVTARPQRAVLLLGIALAALLPLILGLGPLGPSELFERYAIAIPVVCLGLLIDLPDRRWMARLASMNLGVYLVHMLAIRGVDHLPGFGDLSPMLRIGLVYATCLLVVLCIRRTRIPHLA